MQIVITKELAKFVNNQKSTARAQSLWFALPDIDVYLRAGAMCSYQSSYQNLVIVSTLCIANVIVNPERQRQGIFKQFVKELTALGKLHGYQELQVENVLSSGMRTYCETRGFKQKLGETPSFWLPIGENSGVDINKEQVD